MDKCKSKVLSQNELAERIAILKRFKHILEEQRKKFQQYLKVLEAQELSIENEDVDKIVEHAELGQSIILQIANIKKVIDPLESLYKDIRAKSSEHFNMEFETEKIKEDLQSLQKNILAQNQKNRDKIQNHLVGLRKQVASIKSISNQKSIFSGDDTASIIDFEV